MSGCPCGVFRFRVSSRRPWQGLLITTEMTFCFRVGCGRRQTWRKPLIPTKDAVAVGRSYDRPEWTLLSRGALCLVTSPSRVDTFGRCLSRSRCVQTTERDVSSPS